MISRRTAIVGGLTAILTGIGDLVGIHNKDLDVTWINQAVRDV